MEQNFREILNIGWGRNWHTSYTNRNCVCLWTLWGGFSGAHGPFGLGVVEVSGSAGEASDILSVQRVCCNWVGWVGDLYM